MPTQREIDAAVTAVTAAATVTRAAQGRLAVGETLTKGDDSPVTIADYAAQAVVASQLHAALGHVEMIGEEDADDLATADHAELLDGVTRLVATAVDDSTPDRVVEWVGIGRSTSDAERYWTLDPIDGTKGFLRNDQYAIALALIEAGVVTLGVLGCPNLPNADGTTGATFVAAADRPAEVITAAGSAPARVATPHSLADARVCESVEAAHSDHDQAAEIVARLGITAEPFRIDSQCKYGAVARGDASIYLRLPTRPGYVEKIWDHAAGKFVVERAGGMVTDITGAPLDFTHGARLEANRGVIATDGRFHHEVLAAVDAVVNG